MHSRLVNSLRLGQGSMSWRFVVRQYVCWNCDKENGKPMHQFVEPDDDHFYTECEMLPLGFVNFKPNGDIDLGVMKKLKEPTCT